MGSCSSKRRPLSMEDEIIRLNEIKPAELQRVPIGRLPREILGGIFLHVAHSPRSGWNWAVIMLVCKLWREVAVTTPYLWSHWDFSAGLHWFRLAFVRTKMAPVYIEIPNAGQVVNIYPEVVSVLRDPRIQERIHGLSIDGHEPFVADLFNVFGNSPLSAFNIQTLSIQTWSFETPTVSILPLNQFFSHRFPRLHRLCVLSCDFDWDVPVFLSSHLMSLTLMKPMGTARPTLAQFLSILESHPTLETLRLGGAAVPVFDPRHTSRLLPIHLPLLRKLSIDGEILNCTYLFKHLSCSLATRIILDMHAESQDDLSVLSSVISAHYKTAKRTTDLARIKDCRSYPHLSFTVADFEWIIRVVDQRAAYETYLPITFFMLKISWPWQVRPIQNNVLPTSLLKPLPLGDIRTFVVCKAPFLSSDEWRHQVLEHLEAVETLDVSCSIISTLLHALRPDNHEDESRGDQVPDPVEGRRGQNQSAISSAQARVVLPHLLALYIEKSHITDDLIECLEVRKEKGFQLNNLVIRGCTRPVGFDIDRLGQAIRGNSWTWDRHPSISRDNRI